MLARISIARVFICVFISWAQSYRLYGKYPLARPLPCAREAKFGLAIHVSLNIGQRIQIFAAKLQFLVRAGCEDP